MRASNLEGQKFGKLTVISKIDSAKQGRTWLCNCECGNQTKVITNYLLSGHTKSCGCLKKPLNNRSGSRIHNIWWSMKKRCNSPSNKDYRLYGERGIKVCDEWMDFNKFYEWSMNHGYKSTLSLDRINVNGNYEPNNCRWTTQKVQTNNKRNNRIIECNGKLMTLKQAAELTGINHQTLYSRIEYGWDKKDWFIPPKRKVK